MMKVGVDTEVSPGMAKDVRSTKQLSNATSADVYSSGSNSQKEYKSKSKGFGKLGGKG